MTRSTTAAVSPPKAPAFMRTAPPRVPGMPMKNSSPDSPARCAVIAIIRSVAPAPTTSRLAVDLDLGERPGQLHHDAVEPAVADEDVGGHADRGHRHLARLGPQERDQVVEVGRLKDRVGRAADPQPGPRRERHLRAQAAAHRGKRRLELAQAAFSPRMARN